MNTNETATIEKIDFVPTPYQTVRAWVYYAGPKWAMRTLATIKEMKEKSIWGGADKEEEGMISFEFSHEVANELQTKLKGDSPA